MDQFINGECLFNRIEASSCQILVEGDGK
jgi:hypothetical protein